MRPAIAKRLCTPALRHRLPNEAFCKTCAHIRRGSYCRQFLRKQLTYAADKRKSKSLNALVKCEFHIIKPYETRPRQHFVHYLHQACFPKSVGI